MEQGCQKATNWAVEKTSDRRRNLFGQLWGRGGAWGKESMNAGASAQRSASGCQEPGGVKECAGDYQYTTGVWWYPAVRKWEEMGIRVISLCPRHPSSQKNKNTAIVVLDPSFLSR